MDSTYVTATVRQNTRNAGEVTGCTVSFDYCQNRNQKIFTVQPCASTSSSGVPSQVLECAKLDENLCKAIPNVNPDSSSGWKTDSAYTDLLVSCNFSLEELIVRCNETNCRSQTFEIVDNVNCDDEQNKNGCRDGMFYSYNAIDENATYANIKAYLNSYGTNEFRANNISSLQENLYPTLCFLPSNTCRDNSSTGVPMERCSMIYSSSELGGLCFDWYITQYNGLMAQRIDTYCNQYSSTELAWWPDKNGAVDPVYTEFSSNDCECVNRFSEPNYQIIREQSKVIFNDACWYTVCIPDYNQLKPEINMFDPSCPTTICAQIVNVVNSKVGRDINVNQYINCSTSYNIEQELQETFNSTLLIVVIIFFAAFCVFGFMILAV